MRVYYKGLEYYTIFLINSLISTSSFISYIFGMLLFMPILEAKFLPSQIKIHITLYYLAKALRLIQLQVTVI